MLHSIVYAIVSAAFIGGFVLSTVLAALVRRKQLKHSAFVTPDQRATIKSHLVEKFLDRVAHDQRTLNEFLDGYFGSAVAAKRQFLEKGPKNVDAIRELFLDSLERKNDEQLVQTLARVNASTGKALRGVDPQLKLNEIAEASRIFNRTQLRVALIGFAALVAMLLVPPWVRRQEELIWIFLAVDSRTVVNEQSLGYRFIFRPQLPPDQKKSNSTGDLGKTEQKVDRSVVDIRTLGVQVVVVTIISVAGICYFAKRPRIQS